MVRNLNSTGERVYRAIKRQILGGDFRPGERIDALQLADEHTASITPVRAALHRLVGEQLVDAHPHEGFHAPAASEPSMRDLYGWNEQVLQSARRMAGAAAWDRFLPPLGEIEPDPAQFIVRLFRGVALASSNAACLAAVEALNDRLSLARLAERRLLKDLASEATGLAAAFASGRSGEAGRVLSNYHRRRIRQAAQIVRLIHRP